MYIYIYIYRDPFMCITCKYTYTYTYICVDKIFSFNIFIDIFFMAYTCVYVHTCKIQLSLTKNF